MQKNRSKNSLAFFVCSRPVGHLAPMTLTIDPTPLRTYDLSPISAFRAPIVPTYSGVHASLRQLVVDSSIAASDDTNSTNNLMLSSGYWYFTVYKLEGKFHLQQLIAIAWRN